MTIVRNQDIREYHASPAISKSGLDLIAKSPLHYWDKYINPNKEPTDTRALKLGRLAHVLLLQPELVDKEYNILPCEKQILLDDDAWLAYKDSPQFNANEWKITEKLAKFIGTNDARETIKVSDYLDIKNMVDFLKKSPEVNFLLSDGEPEISFYSGDKRCRVDYLRNDGIIIDYKTVAGGFFSDGSAASFQKIAYKFGYHKQSAWYSDILKELGLVVEGFVFIVQEKARPYAYGIYQLDEDFIDVGRKEIMQNYELYKKCLETNVWDSYTKGIININKPSWL